MRATGASMSSVIALMPSPGVAFARPSRAGASRPERTGRPARCQGVGGLGSGHVARATGRVLRSARRRATAARGERAMLSREDNDLLTRTGPGTAMGAQLREYWMPVVESKELLPGGRVKRVQLLGERLIVFRGTSGVGA